MYLLKVYTYYVSTFINQTLWHLNVCVHYSYIFFPFAGYEKLTVITFDTRPDNPCTIMTLVIYPETLIQPGRAKTARNYMYMLKSQMHLYKIDYTHF